MRGGLPTQAVMHLYKTFFLYIFHFFYFTASNKEHPFVRFEMVGVGLSQVIALYCLLRLCIAQPQYLSNPPPPLPLWSRNQQTIVTVYYWLTSINRFHHHSLRHVIVDSVDWNTSTAAIALFVGAKSAKCFKSKARGWQCRATKIKEFHWISWKSCKWINFALSSRETPSKW